MLVKVKLADGTIVWMEKGLALPTGATLTGEEKALAQAAPAPTMEETIAKAVADASKLAAAEAVKQFAATQKATNNAEGINDPSNGSVDPVDGENVDRSLPSEIRKHYGTPERVSIPRGASHAERVQVLADASAGKAINAARLIKAMAVAKMEGCTVDSILQRWGYKYIRDAVKRHAMKRELMIKAMTQSTFADGGAFVPEEFSTELIELLRNMTLVRRSGARVLPMGASLTIPEQTSAGSASYGVEGAAITPSKQGTGQKRMTEKKLTALTSISNDLVKNSSIGAEEFVRADLVAVMALTEDTKMIFGVGAAGEPIGLKAQLNAAHKYAATAAAPTAPTLAEVKKEFNKGRQLIKKANVPMLRPVVWLPSRLERAILDLVGPGGEGTNQLEREMIDRGTIRSAPYYVSEQIPDNEGGGSDEAQIFMFDMDSVIIGESNALEVSVFPDGHYEEGGVAKSGIARDETVVRCIAKHDILLRHDKAGVDVTTVRWA